MIIDTFIFHDELDTLEIRLNTLAPYVERFVLVESTVTFSGMAKPLFYQENKKRFQGFPITHVIVADTPATQNRRVRETWQRRSVTAGLENLSPDDIILHCDVDEIPYPKTFELIGDTAAWSMTNYYYTVNQIIDVVQHGPTACRFKLYQGADEMRKNRFAWPLFVDQCWHFSWFGGIDRMIRKLHSFGHAELDTPQYADPDHLRLSMERNQDLFGRGYPMRLVSTSPNLPPYLLANREKFPHFFLTGY